MPFVDVSKLPVAERLPGWYGRYFHSPTMTFAHYDFVRGSSIHEHFHSQEEVYEVIEGELEVTIDGVAQIARAGLVAIVPPQIGKLSPSAWTSNMSPQSTRARLVTRASSSSAW
ncbi:MAG TPA: cupin domain-containing protein, partial [Candidatus Sulfotelmatobacter sp.]|nr:cupin domain-containing protein [Candidatus Sulfotelmatobacter sp.]